MGVRNWGKKSVSRPVLPSSDIVADDNENVDNEADPFAPGGAFAVPAIPRLSPSASPTDRKALVNELRGLVQAGEYHVDAEVVALAVMNADGRMIVKGDQ